MLQKLLKICKGNATLNGIKKYSSLLENTHDPTEDSKNEKQKWKRWWDGSMRSHPGACNLPAVRLPEVFDKNAAMFLKQGERPNDTENIKSAMQKLVDILWSRDVPLKYIENKKEQYERHLWIKQQIKIAKQKPNLTNWKPIMYDELLTAIYFVSRTPGSYVASTRVLNEIKLFKPDFAPNNMLDFGAGPGSSVWAANELWPNISNYYCIEPSSEMNSLANFLHSGNRENVEFMGIHIRKDFKAYFQQNYDIVHCSFALSEISSKKERLQIIKDLWAKTSKYFVVIEYGNRSGYSLIMEVRDCLKKEKDATIFSPCPHTKPCPMKSNMVCSFTQQYFIPNYARKFYPKSKITSFEKFSYIVFERSEESNVSKEKWPRVIKNPNWSKLCVECHLCTANGEIEHTQIRKQNHGTELYQLSRICETGDLFPVNDQS